jgi:hypothetical protein
MNHTRPVLNGKTPPPRRRLTPPAGAGLCVPRAKPPGRTGRPTREEQAQYGADLQALADRLLEIEPTVGFPCGARGWCYIAEEKAGLTKADFDDE